MKPIIAQLSGAVFNLKKRELRITFTAYLDPEIINSREELTRLAGGDDLLYITVEKFQNELPLA